MLHNLDPVKLGNGLLVNQRQVESVSNSKSIISVSVFLSIVPTIAVCPTLVPGVPAKPNKLASASDSNKVLVTQSDTASRARRSGSRSKARASRPIPGRPRGQAVRHQPIMGLPLRVLQFRGQGQAGQIRGTRRQNWPFM